MHVIKSMQSVLSGVVLGVVAGGVKIGAVALANASQQDLSTTLAVVVPVSGFGWYLSHRLTKIEDALNDLDCQKCKHKKGK